MSIITCPNCKALLEPLDKSMQCINGHSFDISKEGYINLLLSNQKKKLNPGDNKKMMNARDSFLKKGYYDFLLETIESAIPSLAPLNLSDSIHFLDLGCGTGYYTRQLFKSDNYKKLGVDISKIGTAIAAKQDKSSSYITSSVFNLPILDHSIDIVTNIFSPVQLSEIERVLKPGGYIVKVVPVGNHMKEVAELVYDTFIPHQSNIVSELESNSSLKIISQETVEKSISLSGIDLHNLVSMTPYLYKFKPSQLDALVELEVTLSFKVIVAQSDIVLTQSVS